MQGRGVEGTYEGTGAVEKAGTADGYTCSPLPVRAPASSRATRRSSSRTDGKASRTRAREKVPMQPKM